MKFRIAILATLPLLAGTLALAADSTAPAENTFDAPHGMKVSVKMVGPYGQDTALQMICVFKHKPGGDTYLSAMKDFDDKIGGLLSALRNRGEFAGELGETILFIPPAGTITPKRILVIGLGEESKLSLDTLRVVGRVAAREAVRLQARDVSWAPVIRDQGNSTIDVGEGDRVFIEAMLAAYDTEKRLQAQKLGDPFTIDKWTIEVGPTYFEGASTQVDEGIKTAASTIADRSGTPYSTAK